MPRPTFVALSRTLLFSSALLLGGCPGGKSSEPPARASRTQRPAAPARAAAPEIPADPAPVDPVPAALPEPGPEPVRAPEILGFSAASTELPAGGTTTLELQIADAQAAAGFWWSATCGAAARDPEAPWRAIYVAPARAGSCTVTVQVENRERTDRREASLTLTVFGGDPDAPVAEPAARPAAPEPQPFYFDESAAAAAAPEPAAPPPPPDARPPEPPAPPVAPPIAAAAAAAGPERWVTVMEDDFHRPSVAAVGGRWREYSLRRPGPAARAKAGNGDWVIRKDALSIWVRNEIGAVEDFVATDEQLAIDGTRVEFELRAELPSSPEAAVVAFWDAGPEKLGSMAQLPGRAGIACSHDGRGGLRLLPLGSPAAARPAAPGAWTRHVVTVRGDRMSWQVGDEPAVEIQLAAPFDPGARGRFVFAIRAHVKQWHKVDVRGFRLSRLER